MYYGNEHLILQAVGAYLRQRYDAIVWFRAERSVCTDGSPGTCDARRRHQRKRDHRHSLRRTEELTAIFGGEAKERVATQPFRHARGDDR